MPVVAGIDEAGYGPILGPLAMTATVFQGEQLDGAVDLWPVLGEAVARQVGRSDDRLLVTDSKKAYSKAAGLRRLEETTLGFLGVSGCRPASLNRLVSAVCPGQEAVHQGYPWYANEDVDVPVDAERETVTQKAERLAQCLEQQGIRFCGVESRILCAAEYNAIVRRTRNKAVLLFEQAALLLHSLWERHAAEGLTVFVDKQGGRNNYEPYLAPEFMGSIITVVREGLERSTYEIRQGDARMGVHFVMNGDEHHFPTALASMYSKYIRELHLVLFNRFWQREMPSLKETAGYAVDAGRFLKDIEPVRATLGIDPATMVRLK